jgi:hypothetical protein
VTTATKEHSIPFSAEMVRAVLDGTKTQSRRPVRPRPVRDAFAWACYHERANCLGQYGLCSWRLNESPPESMLLHCPFGHPGDTLRISEAVKVTAIDDEQYQLHYQADNSIVVRYGEPGLIAKIRGYKSPLLRGVNLPPAYARRERLQLESVRVERVNAITSDDTIAEGVESLMAGKELTLREQPLTLHQLAFSHLWESIYGLESWERDWCWALTFKVLA